MFAKNELLKTILPAENWEGTPVDSDGKFMNINFPFKDSFWDLLKWQTEKNVFKEEKKREKWSPQVDHDISWLTNNKDCLIWLGHCSYYLRINGITLLIDPIFGDILSKKRKTVFPFDPAVFKNLDYVLLSHYHRDHMDENSLRLIQSNNPNVKYLAGLGNKAIIKQFTKSDNIEIAGWYQQFITGNDGVEIFFLPTRHWSKRGLSDTNERLWGAFVIKSKALTIYFGGDSGCFTGLSYTDVKKLSRKEIMIGIDSKQ
jgi:hypothetical protein